MFILANNWTFLLLTGVRLEHSMVETLLSGCPGWAVAKALTYQGKSWIRCRPTPFRTFAGKESLAADGRWTDAFRGAVVGVPRALPTLWFEGILRVNCQLRKLIPFRELQRTSVHGKVYLLRVQQSILDWMDVFESLRSMLVFWTCLAVDSWCLRLAGHLQETSPSCQVYIL